MFALSGAAVAVAVTVAAAVVAVAAAVAVAGVDCCSLVVACLVLTFSVVEAAEHVSRLVESHCWLPRDCAMPPQLLGLLATPSPAVSSEPHASAAADAMAVLRDLRLSLASSRPAAGQLRRTSTTVRRSVHAPSPVSASSAAAATGGSSGSAAHLSRWVVPSKRFSEERTQFSVVCQPLARHSCCSVCDGTLAHARHGSLGVLYFACGHASHSACSADGACSRCFMEAA